MGTGIWASPVVRVLSVLGLSHRLNAQSTADERLREEKLSADERLREEKLSADERLREEKLSTDERLREEKLSTDERLREEESNRWRVEVSPCLQR
jgi:hypothetical protein